MNEKEPRFMTASIHLFKDCNLNCSFCYRDKKGKPEKTLEFWKNLIPYFKDNLKINGENWQGLFHELQKINSDNPLLLTNLGEAIIYFNGGIKYLYGAGEMKRISAKTIDDIDQKYDSIFVIYRTERPELKLPSGYALAGDFSFESKGYKEDKNLKVDIGFLHYRMK